MPSDLVTLICTTKDYKVWCQVLFKWGMLKSTSHNALFGILGNSPAYSVNDSVENRQDLTRLTLLVSFR